jgi:hypothetical protein
MARTKTHIFLQAEQVVRNGICKDRLHQTVAGLAYSPKKVARYPGLTRGSLDS